jgi:acetyl-CoA carboxylase biotin carboxylase subunit
MMKSKCFNKILIANRGEIALRIMRTCRAMGITSVAVYSDADESAAHTRIADQAVHIGAPPATESYLNIDRIIEAASKTRADAIHPGYGFLSENAAFADACRSAGIAFIGPSSDVIRKMGSKSVARRLAVEAGVPVVPGYDVPGYDREAQDIGVLRDHAIAIGFPVLIKASAGGGGKGMRVVNLLGEFEEAAESARREAQKAFGDGTLLLEQYIAGARHVEFQILGDAYGNLVHLFERDCSIQRRHQKIIEESPSPAIGPDLRLRMGEAAVALARAIGYSNAGTVEFILGPAGDFYFIEVNTRLQVEHPVTEMVTGLDIVKLQIEIAEGKPLGLPQNLVRPSGHAIEARLYAESPANNFLPSTGVIGEWAIPGGDEALRIDAGVETGSEIGIFYDPMLAKIIAWAPDRETAIRKLAYGLRNLWAPGLDINREFLINVLEHEVFRKGSYDTGFVAAHVQDLVAPPAGHQSTSATAAAVVALYQVQAWQSQLEVLRDIPPGYRNNPFQDPVFKCIVRGSEINLTYHRMADDAYDVSSGDWKARARILSYAAGAIRLEFDGIQSAFRVSSAGHHFLVQSGLLCEEVTRLPRFPERTGSSDDSSADSPMPGQVIKVLVAEGQEVAAGEPLVILEAMKMEQTVRAAVDGVVHAILIKAGDLVSPGEVLIQIGGKAAAG